MDAEPERDNPRLWRAQATGQREGRQGLRVVAMIGERGDLEQAAHQRSIFVRAATVPVAPEAPGGEDTSEDDTGL